MSFFPQAFVSDSSFHPLFRFIDDFDQYSRGASGDNTLHHSNRQRRGQLKSFTPRFDVKEVQDGYELHGELPGIEQKDVDVEFTDSQTLTIKGRTERTHSSCTPPSFTDAIQQGGQAAGAIEEAQRVAAATPATGSVTSKHDQTDNANKDHHARYWVSERSVGEFSRSFSFPVRVDQDAVKASMKNGVLSIFVPKAKKAESRRINIE